MPEPSGPGERPGAAGNGSPKPTGPREPFGLDDAELHHGGLRLVQTAIARGWLEGLEHADRRASLVDALVRLARDPATPVQAVPEACRLLALSMAAANLVMLNPHFRSPSEERPDDTRTHSRKRTALANLDRWPRLGM